MVEKIDRPEAPPPYSITRPKESAEDRHQQHNPKDDAERERKRRLEQKEWQKFGKRTVVIKPLRVPRENIARCLFKAVALHSGIGTLKVDVLWNDGKRTENALMLVHRLEDFLKLRRLATGDAVPEELWVRGPTVELGIPHVLAEAGALSGREIEPAKQAQARPSARTEGLAVRSGLVDRSTRKINWGLAMMYGFIAVLAIAAVAAIIAQLR